MKPINFYSILIFISLFFGACGESGPFPPDPPQGGQDTIFEMLWATRIDFDKEIVGTDNTQQYENWVLVGGDIGFPPTLMAFNKETGEKDWEYIHSGAVQDEIDVSIVFQNIYIGMCSGGIVGIDLDTRITLWEINLKAMNLTRGVKFDMFENNLYFRSVWGLGSESQSTRFYKLNPSTGDYEIVYQTDKGLINPPTFYIDDNSRVNIIFNEYPWENDLPEKSVQNLIRIDYETGEEIWRKDSISHFFSSNLLHNAVIYDNRIVITGGDWHMYAFDIITGELLWKTSISDDSPFSIFTKTNHLIYNDRLYVNENGENVTCLNPETGELIWNNPKGGPNCTDNMIYYEKEDLLVFTSWGYGSVMILDALNGETVHRESKYDESQYNNDIVYDEERDMFFTSSYKHAIAFKLGGP